MTKIISVLSPKGGVGKSTITRLLATNLHTKFNTLKTPDYVRILDLDYPQLTIVNTRKKEIELLKNKEENGNYYYNNNYYKIYNDNFQPLIIDSSSITDVVKIIKNEKQENVTFLEQYLTNLKSEYCFIDIVGSANVKGYDQKFLKNIDYLIIPSSIEVDEIEPNLKFINNIVIPMKKAGLIKEYYILLNKANVKGLKRYEILRDYLINNGYSVFNTILPMKSKYMRLYMDTLNKGILSTVFPVYDRQINSLVQEIKLI